MYQPPIKITGAPIRSPIRRPMQRQPISAIDGILGSQKIISLIQELEDLKAVWIDKIEGAEKSLDKRNDIDIQKLNELKSELTNFVRMAENEIERRVKIIQKGDKGDDGYTPIKGKDYFDGEDGKTPKIDEEKIVRSVLAKLPFISTEKEEAEIDDSKLLEKLDKKLNIKHIDGLEQTLHALQTQTKQGYLHGGGVPSLQAGTGIVLTKTSDGGYSITSTSSGGFTELPATGDIDGANVTFTFTQKPNRIISDHVWYKENLGWTWNAGSLTATMTVPPVDELYGYV